MQGILPSIELAVGPAGHGSARSLRRKEHFRSNPFVLYDGWSTLRIVCRQLGLPVKISIVCSLLILSAGASPAPANENYPTSALADYVLACLRSNGETRDMLERCSCSIDVIASVVPYDRYVAAETFRRMAQTSGEASGLFRESAAAKAAVTEFRRAQAEADVRCF